MEMVKGRVIVMCLIIFALVMTEAHPTTGWLKMKHMNPKMEEVAEFAVTEHNKNAKANLKLRHIVSGMRRRIGEDLTLKFILALSDSHNYEAAVLVVNDPFSKKLVSFKRIA